MTENMQIFLPAKNRTPLKFLQQVLREEKSVILRQQVPLMFVPTWTECGVRAVWPQAIRVAAFRSHMPDDWTATVKTERRFFFGVLATIAPQFLINLVNEARQLRHTHR